MSGHPQELGNPLARPLAVTQFRDRHARTRKEFLAPLEQLADAIRKRSADAKDKLPWLKLASFGEVPTVKGTLRHDANVRTISGVEADYDGEDMGVSEAVELLAAAGIAAMVYTSPSHTDAKPRWRVLCPCSTDLPPENRARLVARLNGALGGILAGESFALSQSYYYGSVDSNPAHRVELVPGEFIDQLDGLDAGAIGKAKGRGKDWTDEVMAERDPAKRDESRSGVAFQMARTGKRQGWAFDEFLERLAAEPDLAEWAKDPRQVQRAWDNAKVEGWETQLMRSDTGKAHPNEANAFAMLRHHPELVGRFAFDEMERVPMVLRRLPGETGKVPLPRCITDGDATDIAAFMQRIAGMTAMQPGRLAACIANVARDNGFHPVRDYLDGLTWDGTPRLSRWLHRYAGAEATPYVEMVARCFIISLVARAYRPGCKVDHMPVLEGRQNAGKSTLCRTLVGDRWFSDSLPMLHNDQVRVSMHLRGKWLVEVAEMSAMSKAETADLKAFLTRQVEKFVPKYGRAEIEEPRQCCFVGTVNPDGNGYLRDPTGGRRYWPVAVADRLDTTALAADRDQLFAEAATAFKAGEPWWPTREFEAEHAAPVQADRRVSDAWHDIIADWLATGPGHDRDQITTQEIAAEVLGIVMERLGATVQGRIGTIMRSLEWTGMQGTRRGQRGRYWERPL